MSSVLGKATRGAVDVDGSQDRRGGGLSENAAVASLRGEEVVQVVAGRRAAVYMHPRRPRMVGQIPGTCGEEYERAGN